MKALKIKKMLSDSMYLKAIIHAVVMPLVMAVIFGIWGYLYLLLPTVMYLTFAKESESRVLFFIIVGTALAFAVAGWCDASITNTMQGGM